MNGIDNSAPTGRKQRSLATKISVVVTLIAVIFAGISFSNMKGELENYQVLARRDLIRRDLHMREVYGLLLRDRGGDFHGGSGAYKFAGGVRVRAGDRWCLFEAYDDFDDEVFREQMDYLAPVVFKHVSHVDKHLEWLHEILDNELKTMEVAADSSSDRLEKKLYQGDPEQHAGGVAPVTTTFIVNSAGSRPRYKVWMRLSEDWMTTIGGYPPPT